MVKQILFFFFFFFNRSDLFLAVRGWCSSVFTAGQISCGLGRSGLWEEVKQSWSWCCVGSAGAAESRGPVVMGWYPDYSRRSCRHLVIALNQMPLGVFFWLLQ